MATAAARTAGKELAALTKQMQALQQRKNKTLPLETSGNFISIPGETGFQAFGKSYLHAPLVKWKVGADNKDVGNNTILVEITREGFKWKNVADNAAARGPLAWTASGVREVD